MAIPERTGKCDFCEKLSEDTEMHYCQPGVDMELCARCWRLGPVGALLGEDWESKLKKDTTDGSTGLQQPN